MASWVKSYVDWLIQQRREDGSFPRRWKAGSNEVEEPTGTTSYAPVPLLVMMSEETGNLKYKQSAARAAEYIWANWGSNGLYVGGASDNPNNTDKEASRLSMEAFLSLYDSTKEAKWLARAQAAADFAESWVWIWNLPMPLDASDVQLYYKSGHRFWLPWITSNHLYGINGLEEYDRALFKKLSAKPADAKQTVK